jgi:hypothetical protein
MSHQIQWSTFDPEYFASFVKDQRGFFAAVIHQHNEHVVNPSDRYHLPELRRIIHFSIIWLIIAANIIQINRASFNFFAFHRLAETLVKTESADF